MVDDYGQKLVNSGYGIDQVRRVIVGGLTGYERRVESSKNKTSNKWRPLHEGARHNAGRRLTKKILGKGNWFKGKTRDHEDEDQNDVHSLSSPKKRQKVSSDHSSGRVVCGQHRPVGVDSKSDRKKNNVQKRGQEDEKRGRVRKHEKQKQLPEKPIHQEPPTITVMFVDQTVGGELAKRLQAAEDRMALMTGYRVRVSETSGSQLCRILPNTNPWSGSHCGRANCYTCG